MKAKKTNRADLEKKRSMFFQVGLLLALGLAFVAFEWQSAVYRVSKVEWDDFPDDNFTIIEIPVTIPDLPVPPPSQPSFALEIVDILVENIDFPDIVFDSENGQNILLAEEFHLKPIEDEYEPEIFFPGSVETQALFNGSPPEQAFRDYIIQNLRYPQLAIDNGIDGKVFVQFVVDQKGNVVDVQVVRSADPSLENEALRLIKSTSGMWNPGKQHGNTVKVRYTFPITFKLQ